MSIIMCDQFRVGLLPFLFTEYVVSHPLHSRETFTNWGANFVCNEMSWNVMLLSRISSIHYANGQLNVLCWNRRLIRAAHPYHRYELWSYQFVLTDWKHAGSFRCRLPLCYCIHSRDGTTDQTTFFTSFPMLNPPANMIDFPCGICSRAFSKM